MANCKEHYERVLSSVYSWMYGGFPLALERNASFFKRYDLTPRGSGTVIDLGAGCGFQSIPLARLGYTMTAIDLDRQLLEELKTHADNMAIETVEANLLEFRTYLSGTVEMAVCMTDTILHLDSPHVVSRLIADVFLALEPEGRFVVTFRDFTKNLEELDRFIPVRSDSMTVFTCFLEYAPETVKVHDLVYRNSADGWEFSKSFYRKLRLSEQWLLDEMAKAGFEHIVSDRENGLIMTIATKSESGKH